MSEKTFPRGRIFWRALRGAACGFGVALFFHAQRMGNPQAQSGTEPPNWMLGYLMFTGIGAFISLFVGAEASANRAAHAAVREPLPLGPPHTGSNIRPLSSSVTVPDWQAFQAERNSLPPLPIEHPRPLSVRMVAGVIGGGMLFIAVLVALAFGDDLMQGRLRWLDTLPSVLTFGIIFGVIAILSIVGQIAARRRAKALGAAAAELNLGFTHQADVGLWSALQSAAVLPGGRVGYVLSGEAASQNVAVFNHTYATGSGKHQSTHHQTVACFRFAEPCFPAFALRPQTFSDNVYLWAKPIDFNFDSHPGFSGQYLLAGENEAAVRSLFNSSILDSLENKDGLCVAGNGGVLVIYRGHQCVSGKDMPAFLEEAFAVAAVFVKAVLHRSDDRSKSSTTSRTKW